MLDKIVHGVAFKDWLKWGTAKQRGGILALCKAIPGSILGVPKFILSRYSMLLGFIDSLDRGDSVKKLNS